MNQEMYSNVVSCTEYHKTVQRQDMNLFYHFYVKSASKILSVYY